MIRLSLALLSCAFCATSCVGAPVYRVTVLPTGLGRAIGMNNRGQVLLRGSARSFIWENGRVTCLQDHGFSGGAKAINDCGGVAGESGWIDRYITDIREPSKHALLWRASKTTDLGILAPATATYARSWANGLNSAGWVVGTSDGPEGSICPFLWKDGAMVDLRPKGYYAGIANAINDQGEIVGSICNEASVSMHAFRWKDGAGHDIGTLGGPSGTATAINERGEVVGYSDTQTAQTQAFLWRNGAMVMLTRPKGFTTTTAAGVNDSGDIVGTATRYALNKENVRKDDKRAVLWRNGAVADLNGLVASASGWSLTAGIAINNSGQILAAGKKMGAPGWLLLTPFAPVKEVRR